MSRTRNFLRNFITGIGAQLLILALGFVSRSVLVKTLGMEYQGLNGLFSNILLMLSLSELGLGTAILYNMYKPIAQGDTRQVYLLMKFYKTAYRVIGFLVLGIGLLILPFLNFFIADQTGNPYMAYYIVTAKPLANIYIVFALYLLQSVSSYLFFAYKSALLNAHQKTHVITVTSYAFIAATNLLQILVLILLHNYYLYVAVLIVSTIVQNCVIARKCDRMYPYINEKSSDKLSKEDIKEILKNCTALSIYKVNGFVTSAKDNLLLSKIVGLLAVGYYSNYTLIRNSIQKISYMLYNSIQASLGDLHATDGMEKEKELAIFKTVNFLTFFINGIVAVGMFVTINPFITVWLGKQFLLSQFFVFLFCVDTYVNGIQLLTNTYRNSMGLFQQAKYRPLAGTIINVAVSLLLVKPLGIHGLLIGTITAAVLTYVWFDPLIIFKYGFVSTPWPYYKTNIGYLLAVISAGAASFYIVGLMPGTGLVYFLICGLISVIVSGLIFCLFFHRTKEFQYVALFLLKLVKKLNRH